MSKENVRLFFGKLSKDTALQEKFKMAGQKYSGQEPDASRIDEICQAEILPLGKEAGFDFTLAELREFMNEKQPSGTARITDDELAAVTGGGTCACAMFGVGTGRPDVSCICGLFGFGNDPDGSSCLCWVGGGGRL